MLDFEWHPGMSLKQTQKSIASLHARARDAGVGPVLEISTKSPDPLGVSLSAFNLKIRTKKYGQVFSVEMAYQSSKIFEHGGPYKDLLSMSSQEAKRDPRLKESGRLTGFSFFNLDFPLVPRTYFYDWLYINALRQSDEAAREVCNFEAFSDIVFNPAKSVNCQGFSAALFVALQRNDLISEDLADPQYFLDVVGTAYKANSNRQEAQRSFI
ncbi:hypothetical protein FHX61_000618 [Cupriavidus alkaliphilus]|uniref:Uncharacterized protein n=2 Tax=Cupriavidus alkaliphilus TaxID=942866 RepID=A0A7W4V6J8_9BURK|nr:hypothetical protein [Cupriavidus alkaliphilus]MBB3006002.1 hypothetical protein [Cupriavidus alkaliphilus]